MHYKAKITVEIDCNKKTCGKCRWFQPLVCWLFYINLHWKEKKRSRASRCQECIDKFKPTKNKSTFDKRSQEVMDKINEENKFK